MILHMCVCMLSVFNHVQLFVILWTTVCQAPLSMGSSRQEYWSGLPYPLQQVFLTEGSKPHYLYLLHWQAGSLPVVPPEKLMILCVENTMH